MLLDFCVLWLREVLTLFARPQPGSAASIHWASVKRESKQCLSISLAWEGIKQALRTALLIIRTPWVNGVKREAHTLTSEPWCCLPLITPSWTRQHDWDRKSSLHNFQGRLTDCRSFTGQPMKACNLSGCGKDSLSSVYIPGLQKSNCRYFGGRGWPGSSISIFLFGFFSLIFKAVWQLHTFI